MSTIMCMTARFRWLDIALLLYVRSISNSLIYLTLVSVIQGLRSCRLSSSRIQEYYRLMKNNINLTPKTRSGYKIFETCLKRRKHGKWITSGVLNNTYLSSFSTKSTTETFSFRTKSKTIASKQEEWKLSYLIMYHFLNASTIKQRVISTMTTHLPSNKEMIFRHITNAVINFIS